MRLYLRHSSVRNRPYSLTKLSHRCRLSAQDCRWLHTVTRLSLWSSYLSTSARTLGSHLYRLSASEGYTMNARSEGYRLFISAITYPCPAPSTMIKVSSSSRLRSRSTPLSAYLKTPKRRAVIRGMMGRVSTALNLHSAAAGKVDRYVCTQIEGEARVVKARVQRRLLLHKGSHGSLVEVVSIT